MAVRSIDAAGASGGFDGWGDLSGRWFGISGLSSDSKSGMGEAELSDGIVGCIFVFEEAHRLAEVAGTAAAIASGADGVLEGGAKSFLDSLTLNAARHFAADDVEYFVQQVPSLSQPEGTGIGA